VFQLIRIVIILIFFLCYVECNNFACIKVDADILCVIACFCFSVFMAGNNFTFLE
jgi:hypothetical protein